MNICTFLGRITRDLEVTDANGTSLLRFSIAVSRKYKDKKGNQAEEVNFLDMTAWDKGAELIAKHFKKGDPIIVHCAAKQEQWQTKEGDKRSAVVFRVNNFEFIPSTNRRNKDEDDVGGDDAGSPPASGGDSGSGGGDDIPF